jgi:hypothetical protein
MQSLRLAFDISYMIMMGHVVYSITLNIMILNISPRMTTEHINKNKEDYSSVTLDVPSNISDIDLLVVFKALESAGFRVVDHHDNL